MRDESPVRRYIVPGVSPAAGQTSATVASVGSDSPAMRTMPSAFRSWSVGASLYTWARSRRLWNSVENEPEEAGVPHGWTSSGVRSGLRT